MKTKARHMGVLVALLGTMVGLAGCERNAQDTPAGEPSTVAPPPPLPPGMKVEVRRDGTGDGVRRGRMVTIHYTGRLADGTPFDSSLDRGSPFTFTVGLGNVIRGLELGVKGMQAGEVRLITIPPELGYGRRGQGKIPPDATLVFEVELLDVR